MQTAIAPAMLLDSNVRVSESILRACVHCGFCNATCPTYQLLGTELEGPRGRIYLIKSVLEEQIQLTRNVVTHLDNCLGCLACETTCPSGVRYSHLIDAARERITRDYSRPLLERLQRWLLVRVLPYPARFKRAVRGARLSRPLWFLAPGRFRAMLRLMPARLPNRARLARPGLVAASGVRRARISLLTGCVQSVMGPQINDAALRLLTRLGCEVVLPPEMGCCGALTYHMGERRQSLDLMRKLIDVWHREIAGGDLDMIVVTTSGCGMVLKDYGHIFRDDPAYADKAAAVSAKVKDVSEALEELGMPDEVFTHTPPLRLAYHDACSLQHAQRLRGGPRRLLAQAGFQLAEVPEGHMCCGSAGTYNLLQPKLARQLGERKAQAVATVAPQAVVTGNIGCMEQIGTYSPLPVLHTVQLLDWATGGPKPKGL